MQVKKQQLELDMEQQTGSKLGKEYVKAVYCHLVYLTYVQSTSRETLDWKKHKLESRLPGEISITSEEGVPENLSVPLQGDRDAGEICGGASRVPRTVSTSNSSRGTSPETL